MEIRLLPVGQLEANCYLLIDVATREAAIVDPGDNSEKIIELVQKEQVSISFILLTHGHGDHSFAAGELQKTFDVDVLMHEADVPQLEGTLDMLAMFYDVKKYVKPRLGRFLADGDTVKLGQTELQVIHTPGHTPGGLCFLSGKHLITGDTLFAGSIGRTDFDGGSYDEIMDSIHNKLLTFEDDTIVMPGHGPMSRIGIERDENPYLG